jgi:hypothetical protein
MDLSSLVRRALPLGLMAVAVTSVPGGAFEPSVPVYTGSPGEILKVTDLGWQGDDQAVTIDELDGGDRKVTLRWSGDGGATWQGDGYGDATRESQVTLCHAQAVMAFAHRVGSGPDWRIETYGRDVDGPSGSGNAFTTSGVSRKPDIACARDHDIVVAWFQKHGSAYHVHLGTRGPGEDLHPQGFDLGTGSVSRGLAIATSSSRVYVTWFQGNALKLRRYSIGSAPNYSLHALGTSTIATLRYGNSAKLGADGDRVILAYMDKADLKVRRSTDRGVSFGSARTLVDEPFPSEVGAAPMTVAVKGSRVAIGVVEVNEMSGRGMGFLSANGGSSYAQQSTHTGGTTGAGLVKVNGSYQYAEAWDQQFSQPNPETVRHRHQ